jgi:hypothetical protein
MIKISENLVRGELAPGKRKFKYVMHDSPCFMIFFLGPRAGGACRA